MARTKISEFSATPGNNTDIDGINLAEGCAPSGINDAIRELMSQLKDFQAGTAGDSFNGPVGTTTAAAGAFTTLSASSTVSGTGFSTYLASPPAIGGTAAAAGSFTTLTTSSTVTHNGGTANGVAYLNGSKVLTTGSDVVYTGNFGIGTASPNYKLAVLATSGAQNIFQAGQSGVSNGYTIASDGTNLTYQWFTSGSEQMRLTSTGLGIGTSSPGGKLEVYAGASGATAFSNGANFIVQNSGAVGMSLLSPDANAARIYFGTASNNRNAFIYSDYNGGAQTLIFGVGTSTTAATERMRLDSSGNLGLGVTPSAWATFTGLQVGALGGVNIGGAAGDNFYAMNAYYNAGWKYAATGYTALMYRMVNGEHRWSNAPSGTAGNAITFTQAMTLDASGNFGVGTTSPSTRIHAVATGGAIRMQDSTGTAKYVQMRSDSTNSHLEHIGGPGDALRINNQAAGTVEFFTSNTERARITSGGELLVNTTTANGQLNVAVPNGTTNVIYLQRTGASTANARVTFANQYTNLFTSDRFQIEAGGSGGVYLAAAGTSWTAVSDERKKDIIEPIANAAQKVSSLRAVIGKYKTDTEGTRRSFLIAQDVQAVLPEAVDTTNSDELGLSYSDVIPLLAAAIKEQQVMINELKAEVAALKAK